MLIFGKFICITMGRLDACIWKVHMHHNRKVECLYLAISYASR